MIERLHAERLSLRRRPEIGLEPVGVENRDESLDGVEGRSSLGDILGDVTTTTSENGEDG